MKIRKTIMALGITATLGALPFTMGAANADGQYAQRRANAMASAVSISECEHAYEKTVITPTCTAGGYSEYVCSICGDKYVDERKPANGHEFTLVTVQPTCTDKGFTTHYCTVCGYQYSDEYTDAFGHAYMDTVYAPTCTDRGYTEHTCSVCGDEYKDDIKSALGHSYNEEILEPDCLNGGYSTFTCEVCGDTYTGKETAANGHSYTMRKINSTCVSYGYTEHTCDGCGDRYVDGYIKPLGHDYKTEIKAATDKEPGYTKNTCKSCGYSFLTDISTSNDDGYIERPQEHIHGFAFNASVDKNTRTIFVVYDCKCGENGIGTLKLLFEDNDGKITSGELNAETGVVAYPEGTVKANIVSDDGVTVKEITITEVVAPSEPDEPIDPTEPEQPVEHSHTYVLKTTLDDETDILKLEYVCECKDDKVTELSAMFTDAKGNKVAITPTSDGEVDYAELNGKYKLVVMDHNNTVVAEFDVTAGKNEPEDPVEPDKPDTPTEPTTPDEKEPNEPQQPDTNAPEQKTKKGSSLAGIFGIILLVLGIGGVATYLIIRHKKKKKNN